MRLTCPNCGAQYEVPDQVIPLDGRDVQCSNCGSTWFQAHPDAVEDDFDDEPQQVQEWDDTGLEPEDASFEDADPVEDAEDDDAQDPDAGVGPDAEPGARSPRSALAQDGSVADVLREEAEREARLRAEEGASGLESQPELGLDQPLDEVQQRAAEARARIARLRHQTVTTQSEAPRADPQPDQRSGVLPDIEEINSSLKSPDKAVSPAKSPASAAARRPNRFYRGFAISVLIAVVLLLVYTNAPQIAQWVPQADPVLNVYVAYVDNARLWLDQQLVALTPASQ